MKEPVLGEPSYVGMGELRVCSRGEVLRATLGSCIGIAVVWKKRGRCGLAHCLLPEAPVQTIRIGARYVSQAVPSLLALLGAKPADHADIEVTIAGGARMLRSCPGLPNVGQLNTQAARFYLAQAGLQVCRIEVGGRRGRQITVDSALQTVEVNPIERHMEEIF
jgi:chemotaxis protein CheD